MPLHEFQADCINLNRPLPRACRRSPGSRANRKGLQMHRLFVAVDIPDSIRQALAGMGFGLPGAKWVDPEQLHLTVRFIGEVEGGLFHDIRECLSELKSVGFSMRLKGVGHFPPRGTPRVIWVGIERNDSLALLKKKLDSALARVGAAPDGRKFSPHITLARLKNTPAQKVGRFIAGNSLYESEPFAVQNFRLYSSLLTPKGAIHTMEAEYPLTS